MIEALLIVVIIGFGIYTFRIGRKAGGYMAFCRSILKTGPSRQVAVDLYIAITLLCIIMVYDAIEVGISLVWVTLYIIISIFMGSFGPLLYLLHRFIVT